MVKHVGCYQIGDWQFDVDTMVLCLDSDYQIESGSSYHHDRQAHSLRLPFKTADLLALLAEYGGEIVPLEVMGERVWNGKHDVAKRGIVNTISKLRGILNSGEFAQYIVNEPLKGYRLCVPVRIIDEICQPIPTPPDPKFAQILGWTTNRKRKRKRPDEQASIHVNEQMTPKQQQQPQQYQQSSIQFLHLDNTRYRAFFDLLYRWRRVIVITLLMVFCLSLQT